MATLDKVLLQINHQLDALQIKEQEAGRELNNLQAEPSQDNMQWIVSSARDQLVSLASNEADKVAQLTSKTSKVAKVMCESIRQLDLEQNRLLEMIQLVGRIERIQILMDKLETHQKILTMDKSNLASLEELCSHVHELDQYPKSVFQAASLRGQHRYEEEVNEKRQFIKEILVCEIPKSPEYSIKLLETIGEIDSGLIRLGHVLREQMREVLSLKEAKSASTGTLGELNYAIGLARHFDYFSTFLTETMERYGGLIRDNSAMMAISLPLLEEIDLIGEKLLKDYCESKPTSTKPTSLRTLDLQITEYSLICRHVYQFFGFIIQMPSLKGNSSGESRLLPKIEAQYERLLDDYPSLELTYLCCGINKALEMEQDYTDLVSSNVDDIFFLVKKAMFRAIGLLEVDLLSTVLVGVASQLQNEYIHVLVRKLKAITSLDQLESKKTFASLLNDFTATSQYLDRLLEDVKCELDGCFPDLFFTPHFYDTNNDADIEAKRAKITTTLDSFEKLCNFAASQAKIFIEYLYSQLVRPRVLIHLQTVFGSFQYNGDGYDANDSAIRILSGFDRLTISLAEFLTPINNCRIDIMIAQDLAQFWERHVLQGKFDQLGALHLDKSIRRIMGFFSERCIHLDEISRISPNVLLLDADSTSMRAIFSKLTQISTILVSEKKDEAVQMQACLLTKQELDRILDSRIDWKS